MAEPRTRRLRSSGLKCPAGARAAPPHWASAMADVRRARRGRARQVEARRSCRCVWATPESRSVVTCCVSIIT
eukprot:4541397-Prymnesium_polylepis.3